MTGVSRINDEPASGPIRQDADKNLSMQVFQHIYTLITKKKEKIRKTVFFPIKVEIEDLSQLDYMLNQALEQYNIQGCLVSRYMGFYDNGENPVFSSLDKFKMQAPAVSSQIESVLFEYEFAIVLPNVSESQSYKVSIRINNRSVIAEKMARTMPAGFPARYINFMLFETIEYNVEYVDYAVSRNIQAVLDTWSDSVRVERSKKVEILEGVLKRYSHFIPLFMQYVGLLLLSIGLFKHIYDIFGSVTSFSDFSWRVLAISLSYFLMWRWMGGIGRFTEGALHSIKERSYIGLTKKDKESLGKRGRKNKMEIFKTLGSAFLSACFGYALLYAERIFS